MTARMVTMRINCSVPQVEKQRGRNLGNNSNRIYFSARRPPVEETASFLQSLLNSHGSNFLEILFGPRAKNNMKRLGGIQNVAIVLSESYTIDDFSEAMKLSSSDLHNLKLIFHSVEQGDLGVLSAIGVKDSELGDMKFFIEKFIKTGFLDI